jgi:hypothetical protein
MKNRKPFQLKKAILMSNLLQVFLSTYLFHEVPLKFFIPQVTVSLQIGMSGWFTGEYSLRCQPVNYSKEPSALRVSSCTTPNSSSDGFISDVTRREMVLHCKIHRFDRHGKFHCTFLNGLTKFCRFSSC